MSPGGATNCVEATASLVLRLGHIEGTDAASASVVVVDIEARTKFQRFSAIEDVAEGLVVDIARYGMKEARANVA